MRGCLEVRIESGRFQVDKENIILQRALADCKLVNVIIQPAYSNALFCRIAIDCAYNRTDWQTGD